jgi:hypothetical protein
MPEEMRQTLLTNKKPGNLDKVHAAKIGAPKKCNKNGPVPYLGLELTIHVIKSQIHYRETVPKYHFDFNSSWNTK